MTRRQFFYAAGAGGAGLGYSFFVEPKWLETTHTRIRFPLRGGGRVRVVQLTDLHLSWAVPIQMIDHAITLALAEKPDFVCLTGDFVTFRAEYDSAAYTRCLKRLSAAVPVYAVLGNHDGGAWIRRHRKPAVRSDVAKVLDESGIELLDNRSVRVEAQGEKLYIAGVADLWSGRVRPDLAFGETDNNLPILLLAHNPDTKDIVDEYGWDMMLSGHTHGGQVRIPIAGELWVPVKDKRFIAGRYDWEDRQLYVSRGVGSIDGVRFLCRPELTVLELEAGKPAHT